MGVKGLWRLINSCGTPVTLESLEHKILAVDVSIWLHQAIRGFKGHGANAGSNAHLLTLFHRICKLLYYRLRPVFIFDGGVPQLKKQTLSSRRLKREAAASKAQKVRNRLLTNLLRSQAVRIALGKKGPLPSLHRIAKPIPQNKDLYELPPLTEPLKNVKDSSSAIENESEEEEEFIVKNLKHKNIHNFEYDANEFKSLPLQQQHEILYELQVTRKENSWSAVNEMPQKSQSFSSFQMDRLLKRKQFQDKLVDIQTEIQKKHSKELEAQLFGELEMHVSQTNRVVSEDSVHSILVKTKSDPVHSETLNEIIHEEKKKSLKKSDIKKDFLTELTKQGLVNLESNKVAKKNFELRFSDSEMDSDDDLSSDDEIFSPSQKRRKIEEVAFLKAIDTVLDDSELSQEEIFSLIKQSQAEIDKESATEKTSKISNNKKENFQDLTKPSTSKNAPGIIYNSDAESSSTDDEDFIEVTDFEIPNPSNSSSENLKEGNKDNACNEVESNREPVNNVDAILTAKTDSLYIKILQQKLDDIVHQQTSSIKNIDTRKISPTKAIHSNSSSNNDDKKGVAIDLELIKKPDKHSIENDIFKDVFNFSNNSNKENISTNLAKVEASSNVSDKMKTSQISEKAFNSNKTSISLTNDIQITDKLKDKITELLKIEIEGMIKKSQVAKSESKYNEPNSDISQIQPASFSGINKSILNQSLSQITTNNSMNEKIEKESLAKSENKPNNESLNQGSIFSSSNISALESKHLNNKNEANIKETQKQYSKELEAQLFGELEMHVSQTNRVVSEDSAHSILVKAKSDPVHSETLNEVIHEETKLPLEKFDIMKKNDVTLEHLETEMNETTINKSFTETDSRKDLDGKMKSSILSNRLLSNYSSDQLTNMESELEKEQDKLLAQAHNVERVAVDISDQAYGDAQQLLRLFSLPYLVAPMEAEAQCGFLDEIGLTHGTITDDSDIFLFGGKNVYKNFFNQSKYVECFKIENIQQNLGLTRNKMITLSMLTGSDYTVGIESVGAVLGMEILSEFPGGGIECLKNLKKWWNAASKNISNIPFSKVKQRILHLYFPESFPNENIFKAYLNPEVDKSDEKFSWGVPNFDELRVFAGEKFGWSRAKTDEIIMPIFKKLGIKETQMHIDSYFSSIKLVKDTPNQSKRLKYAIAKAKGEQSTSNSIPVNNDKEKKLTKKTKLIDPSQGNYGNVKRQKVSKRKAADEPLGLISQQNNLEVVNEEKIDLHKPITKEEKKSLIYKKLLEKEKILQAEKEKSEKNEKKALAALALAKNSPNKKKK